MASKQKPGKEKRKPKQTKAHAAVKVMVPIDFMSRITRKGWHLNQRGIA